MRKTLVFSLIVMGLLVACKKDKDEVSLQNKWTVDNFIGKEYLNGTLTNTTTLPGGGATLDFQKNGNVIITTPGSPVESFPYILQPGSRVEFGGDNYEIRDLTGSSVTLFLREDYAPGDYDEIFINLKK